MRVGVTILGFGGGEFTKSCDSLPCTPMNCRAKSDAASFILGVEIRNGTDPCTQKNKQTNIKQYIHTLPIGMCG